MYACLTIAAIKKQYETSQTQPVHMQRNSIIIIHTDLGETIEKIFSQRVNGALPAISKEQDHATQSK
ncbi:hypothetical protein JCM19240_713 [Vibrio maritimus]|uniref:Uncharacterized protein n=1 Tax=Vibrio maritimus TaxID=990268 RepID=A0A090TCE7_9VIBR|nr:hypothetical protein JCM19240_713 [Vibrio maritimus]